jgi:hypothetical protein
MSDTTEKIQENEIKKGELILVYYINVSGFSNEQDMVAYVQKVMQNVSSKHPSVGEIICIPSEDEPTRIECINPKYITEPELIRQHRLLMDELHENLNYEINEQKNKKTSSRA